MGTNMPGDNHDALEWLEGRIAGWVADPTAIGLTSAVVIDLAADIADTRSSFTGVEQIRGDSKAATTAFHLNGDGSVTVSWDARGPTGTVYNVSRKLATEAVFTFIGQGAAQDKQFIDATVPAGTITAAYIIQGVRGGNLGLMSNAMTVFFGTADAEGMSLAA